MGMLLLIMYSALKYMHQGMQGTTEKQLSCTCNFPRQFLKTLSQHTIPKHGLVAFVRAGTTMLCVCLQTSSASFSITQTCQPKDPGLYHQFESRHQGCLVRHVPAKIAHGGHNLYVWLTADQPTLIGSMLYGTAIASQHADLEAQQKLHLQFRCTVIPFSCKALPFPPKDYMLQLEGIVHWWEWQGRQAGGIDNTNEYKYIIMTAHWRGVVHWWEWQGIWNGETDSTLGMEGVIAH